MSNIHQDHACLSFLPCEGKLPPCGSSSVTIKCHPEETGHLQSIMQLLVNGKPYQYVILCLLVIGYNSDSALLLCMEGLYGTNKLILLTVYLW